MGCQELKRKIRPATCQVLGQFFYVWTICYTEIKIAQLKSLSYAIISIYLAQIKQKKALSLRNKTQLQLLIKPFLADLY